MINRLHRDRNKLFHRFNTETTSYYCVNRTWYHYYEWMYHCNLDTDILFRTVGDVPITICDLYLKDKQYLSGDIPREDFWKLYTQQRPIRDLFWKMERNKRRSGYMYNYNYYLTR